LVSAYRRFISHRDKKKVLTREKAIGDVAVEASIGGQKGYMEIEDPRQRGC
jgi:hypothetical protein